MLRAKELAPPVTLLDGKAQLLSFEHLIDPEIVESDALLWPWREVGPHLGVWVDGLDRSYNGRPLYCLYNPATGTRNGTTFAFFCTIAKVPPDVVGPSHRHNSAAINYILEGSGWSVVEGRRLEYGAGDIMLAAPGWGIHGHASGPDGMLVFNIQDHPLHIGAESLIWQEDLKAGPILSLGTQAGFQTNMIRSVP